MIVSIKKNTRKLDLYKKILIINPDLSYLFEINCIWGLLIGEELAQISCPVKLLLSSAKLIVHVKSIGMLEMTSRVSDLKNKINLYFSQIIIKDVSVLAVLDVNFDFLC